MIDFKKIAKNIVGNWGYEEPYWWRPIERALKRAYKQGKIDSCKDKNKKKYG
jgi:hypothetical protein